MGLDRDPEYGFEREFREFGIFGHNCLQQKFLESEFTHGIES